MSELQSRRYHAIRAVYCLFVFIGGTHILLYIVGNYLEHEANIAFAGLFVGLFLKDHFIGYAKHAGGVLAPYLARNIETND